MSIYTYLALAGVGLTAYYNQPSQLTNPFFEQALKNAYPSLKDGCHRFLGEAIYNSREPALIDQAISLCSIHLNDSLSLHVASAARNDLALEALHSKKIDLNLIDHAGASALHHAAMVGYDYGIQKLLEWEVDPKIRMRNGATYMDILRFTQPFRSTPYPLDPTLFSAHKHENYTVQAGCLPSGAQLIYETVTNPENYIVDHWGSDEHWGKETLPREKEKLEPFLLKKYEQFKKHPPKLSIASIHTDDYGKPLATPLCGLIADEPIKKGEVVGEYVGFNGPHYSPEYRGAGSMINDGFPNVKVFDINHTDGLKARKLFYALENIDKGKQILIHYGYNNKVKGRGYIDKIISFGFIDIFMGKGHMEMAPKALEDFFRLYSWTDLLKASHEARESSLEHIDVENKLLKLAYTLETPSALTYLAEKGLLTKDDIKASEAKIVEISGNGVRLDT